ncbi:MAG: PAS domain S-box protein [Chloroflexi bacterium]|nr:PAS domain S-box protein [Chloroflexota bacterium]
MESSILRSQRDLGIALSSTSDIEEALRRVLLTFTQIEGIDSGGAYLVDDQTGELTLVVYRGLSAEFAELTSHFDADSPQARLVSQGAPIYSAYAEVAPNLDDVRAREGLRAIAVLPVQFNGQVVAALNLASHTHDEIPTELRLTLETTAALVGGAVARVRAESAVQESQQNLQSLFDLLEDFLFILDEDGRILHVNPIVEKRLGYAEAELQGQPILMVHPPERHDEAASIIAAMLAGQESACLVPLLAKDGRQIPVDTIVTPGKWGGKDVLFGVSRDMSERERAREALQESQRTLATLMSNLPGMAYRCLTDWTMTFVSDGCLALTEYGTDDLIDNKTISYRDLIHPDDREMVWQVVKTAVQASEPFRINYRIITRSVREKWVCEQGCEVDKMEDGAQILEGFITDINERKLAEGELERYANELERRVAERTSDLTEANERLQELDRLKSKFVSDVSHELRTPVTNLFIYLDLLERGKPERGGRYQAILREQADRLKMLVEDTLDLSRLDLTPGAVEFGLFDVNEVVAQAVAAQQSRAEVKEIFLDFAPGENIPLAWGAMPLVGRIVSNLLENAINYTHEGEVTVSTEFDTAIYQILLRVQDTGIGMNSAERHHCFDSFYRGERVGQLNVPGNGLGLTLVKEIVTLHNGRISVDSALDRGSVFSVWLPAAEEHIL